MKKRERKKIYEKSLEREKNWVKNKISKRSNDEEFGEKTKQMAQEFL